MGTLIRILSIKFMVYVHLSDIVPYLMILSLFGSLSNSKKKKSIESTMDRKQHNKGGEQEGRGVGGRKSYYGVAVGIEVGAV